MNTKSRNSRTIDQDEVKNFDRMASQWWDELGPFKPLHQLNPARIQFIREVILTHYQRESAQEITEPFSGLTILDIGCGGGLVTEPMARLGATVTGIDASSVAIQVATQHAQAMGLTIEYRCVETSQIVEESQGFDVVIALEIVEHVADVKLFLEDCMKLVKPGGCLIMSTLNRTWKSYLMAIIGAEYVLRWLPKGTHTWQKFITPAELTHQLRGVGLSVKLLKGLEFNPCRWSWSLGQNLDINYLVYAIKG
jgi:2-polyprenyl-6-hydroxyphenyl methylase / 3-demethylubiquinone-9 3-methyltransferase